MAEGWGFMVNGFALTSRFVVFAMISGGVLGCGSDEPRGTEDAERSLDAGTRADAEVSATDAAMTDTGDNAHVDAGPSHAPTHLYALLRQSRSDGDDGITIANAQYYQGEPRAWFSGCEEAMRQGACALLTCVYPSTGSPLEELIIERAEMPWPLEWRGGGVFFSSREGVFFEPGDVIALRARHDDEDVFVLHATAPSPLTDVQLPSSISAESSMQVQWASGSAEVRLVLSSISMSMDARMAICSAPASEGTLTVSSEIIAAFGAGEIQWDLSSVTTIRDGGDSGEIMWDVTDARAGILTLTE